MRPTPRIVRVAFTVVVTLCLLQIAWWVFFQYREADRAQRSETIRLEATCYRALVSLAESVRDTENQRTLFERELAIQYRELELADAAGQQVPGVRVDTVLASGDAGFRALYVRPTQAAIDEVLDKANRRRIMFVSEGIALMLVVLVGVVLLYAALRREMRLQRQHESFLAGATHEMKTPLATLRLGLETLGRGWPEPERASRYLHQMVGQVDRVQMQVENLLREAAGGGTRLNRLPGDLVQDVRDAVAEAEPRLASREVHIRVEAPETELRIERDREALQQVLRNLLDNALKYSPKNGTIHVTLLDDASRGIVRVSDEGEGIMEADRDYVFDKFYRGQSQPSESKGGTGLGLFVSRQTVLAHGGDLRLCRSNGRGACFELRLPIRGSGA